MSTAAAADSAPWDLLARQLAGEATPADAAAVRAWQAAAPGNAALWQQLTGMWSEASAASMAPIAPVFNPADTAAAWQRFEANVLGPPPLPNPTSAPQPGLPVSPGVVGLWGKAAALLVVGAGAGWLLRTTMPPAEEAPATAPIATTVARPTETVAAPSANVAAEVDLVFENTPVRTVARRLERAFPGTTIAIPDSGVARQQFTGTFRGTRPAVVLRVVGVATGATALHQADSTWVLQRAAE